MKKPLTEAERERRRILREKHEELKITKIKESRRKFFSYLSLALILTGSFAATITFDVKHNTDLTILLIAVNCSAGFIAFDNSGIRTAVFSRLPDKFPFANELKRKNKGQCKAVELCKTLSYFSLLFYPIIPALFAIVWIICEITAFLHLIFDKDTCIRPPETPHNGLSAAGDTIIITSGIMLLFQMDNIFINNCLIAFTLIFTISAAVLFILRGSGYDAKSDVIILILGAEFFSFAGFCAVNKDLDFSEPQKYIAVIEDMNHTSGKNNHYKIYVNDWKGSGDTVSIEVNSDDFRNLEIGDTVIVYEYNGALGMNYYDYSAKYDFN